MGLIISTPTEEAADKPTALDVTIVVETITAAPSDVASNVNAHLQSTRNFKCDIKTLREAVLGSNEPVWPISHLPTGARKVIVVRPEVSEVC